MQKIIRITDYKTTNSEILNDYMEDGWEVKMISTASSNNVQTVYFHTIIVLEKNV